MLRLINGLLDRVCVVAGALIFSQAPQFIQQYTQRLGGHIAELKSQVEMIRQTAAFSGKNIEQYIHRFTSSPETDLEQQGLFLQRIVDRLATLSSAMHELQDAASLAKPFVLLGHFQLDVAQGTLQAFQPGLSLNAEGICYALMGIVIAHLLYIGASGTFKSIFRRRASQLPKKV